MTALCAVVMVPVAVLTRVRLSFPGPGRPARRRATVAALVLRCLVLRGARGLRPGWRGSPGHPGHAAAAIAPAMPDPSMAASAADMGGAMFAAHAMATLGTAHFCSPAASGPCPHLFSWLRPSCSRPSPAPPAPACPRPLRRQPGPPPGRVAAGCRPDADLRRHCRPPDTNPFHYGRGRQAATPLPPPDGQRTGRLPT